MTILYPPPHCICASILTQRCPACFGGIHFGRPLNEGGDIHVATDGNFHHQHRRSAGDCPRFYDPSYFLPKTQVDDVGCRILSLRKRPLKKHTFSVPYEAIDQCEDSYEAADGKKQKAAMDSFNDTGYDILPSSVTLRLRFATTAMHAYSHEWACQLEYNPRMCIGLGLSDGEDSVKLIGIQRLSSCQRCLWLIDRQAAAIGMEMQVELGDWIKCRLKRGVNNQGSAVKEVLINCGIPTEDLQTQWSDQKKSQLSIRARTSGLATEETLDAVASLERSHEHLMNKVEVLYSSLNIHDRFPELQDVDLDFVQTLMACNLKINIWKRAIGSFFEWDKLDHAIGGANQALGTKLHQQTCKAIVKRQPALMTAIRKFNSYCEHLESLYDPAWDVWITPSVGNVPCWIEDVDVRDGIRAMLKWDRCQEEQRHLGLEADNLCWWFRDELAALELALHSPSNQTFLFTIQQHRDHVLQLQTRWVTPLASSTCFTSNGNAALKLAIDLSGSRGSSVYTIKASTYVYHWIQIDKGSLSDLFVEPPQRLQ
ncbi:uncharacterized protein EDB91DRAFT_1268520 [Suillus paluster]|uniref:uncharacterized protein n=1 Tax=Suillus paluster TaxID=48578 RepID=UPI001B87DBDA|nr:uncharacterized protein EDB91DRAFT_1268520 [Suillus paluster]KAG1745891.1 hypothetical protein EDB91DRAFT_1268520 [Suillus paluster]